MPFPEANRVIFRNSPLESVICQVRFPPILLIEKEAPAEFQQLIRGDFPLYTRKIERKFELQIENGPKEAQSIFQSPENVNHEFSSSDEKWTINLTSGFLAMTSRDYTRWEIFKERFLQPLTALVTIYSPSFYSRIGLRYKDVIRRSALGLEKINWSELLNPFIAGPLSASNLAEGAVQSTLSNTVIQLSDKRSYVRLIHGLAEDKNSGETLFLLDSDFYIEDRTELDDGIGRLDYFNQRGTRLIQWAITDRLRSAMAPEQI